MLFLFCQISIQICLGSSQKHPIGGVKKKKRHKKKNNKHCFLTKSSHTYIVGGRKKRGEKKEGNKPCTFANVRLQGYYGLYFFNKE